MQDLNFFINPHAKKQQAPIAKILLIAVAVILVLFAGLFYYLFDQTNKANQAIAQLEAQLNDPTVLAARTELAKVQQKIALLKQYDQSLTDIETYLQAQSRIDKVTLDQITAAIPQNVSYTIATITNTDLALEVTSINDDAKAQLVHNLKATDLFSSVQLQSASLVEDETAGPSDRTLVVLCIFKEVTPE